MEFAQIGLSRAGDLEFYATLFGGGAVAGLLVHGVVVFFVGLRKKRIEKGITLKRKVKHG